MLDDNSVTLITDSCHFRLQPRHALTFRLDMNERLVIEPAVAAEFYFYFCG